MAARRYFNGRYVNAFMPVLKKDGVVVSPYLIGFETRQHDSTSSLTDTLELLWGKSWGEATKALRVTDSDLTVPAAPVTYTIVDPTMGNTLVVPPLSDEDVYHKKLVKKLRKMIWKEQQRYSMDVYGFHGGWERRQVCTGVTGDRTHPVSHYLIGEVVFGPRGGARFVERG